MADFRGRESFFGKVKVVKDFKGNLEIQGNLTEKSDRNAKTGISAVDVQVILERVENLPISTWSYKNNPGVKHIGPMSQDFKAAFAVGDDETSISTIDRDGVALAAIKALNQLLKGKDNKIAELEERLARIESIINQ